MAKIGIFEFFPENILHFWYNCSSRVIGKHFSEHAAEIIYFSKTFLDFNYGYTKLVSYDYTKLETPVLVRTLKWAKVST